MKDLCAALGIAFLPAVIILLQNETGSALVFAAFVFVLFREGMPAFLPSTGVLMILLFILALAVPQIWLLSGIGVVFALIIFFIPKKIQNIIITATATLIIAGVVVGVDFFVNNVLQPHQQNRIKVLFNPDIDPLGTGWNVTQSKIAIGSGGLNGKGFLEGTQTKFDFVPEQSTDFIFCTIGEEHGWIGSTVVIGLFVGLLFRIIFVAERQKSRFGRVYGYGVASIIFFHFMVNIGMTIGLFPVIGIPLPFFSYGGSSLWSFTILLWILLKIDAHRGQVLNRGI
jgi:rod shape determining protein RodA